jgi:hypothetical protein
MLGILKEKIKYSHLKMIIQNIHFSEYLLEDYVLKRDPIQTLAYSKNKLAKAMEFFSDELSRKAGYSLCGKIKSLPSLEKYQIVDDFETEYKFSTFEKLIKSFTVDEKRLIDFIDKERIIEQNSGKGFFLYLTKLLQIYELNHRFLKLLLNRPLSANADVVKVENNSYEYLYQIQDEISYIKVINKAFKFYYKNLYPEYDSVFSEKRFDNMFVSAINMSWESVKLGYKDKFKW